MTTLSDRNAYCDRCGKIIDIDDGDGCCIECDKYLCSVCGDFLPDICRQCADELGYKDFDDFAKNYFFTA